jgi:hypothetical protein
MDLYLPDSCVAARCVLVSRYPCGVVLYPWVLNRSRNLSVPYSKEAYTFPDSLLDMSDNKLNSVRANVNG